MIGLVKTLRWIVRLCALALVVLGIGFWTGNWMELIPLHMTLGIVLVVSFWITALAALSVRAPAGMVIAALVWGAVVVWLGMTQMRLLPGSAHWVVQVIHLLIGLGAAGFNERLSRLIEWKGSGTMAAASR
jgi:hypothetical protein